MSMFTLESATFALEVERRASQLIFEGTRPCDAYQRAKHDAVIAHNRERFVERIYSTKPQPTGR
jgi:hypothetical protein